MAKHVEETEEKPKLYIILSAAEWRRKLGVRGHLSQAFGFGFGFLPPAVC